MLPPGDVRSENDLSRWHEWISMSDRNVSATRRICSSGVRKLTNAELKKRTDRMLSKVTCAGKNSSAFVPLIVVLHSCRIAPFYRSLRANFQNTFKWILCLMKPSRRITSAPDSTNSIAVS
jgi:hypothetical protein